MHLLKISPGEAQRSVGGAEPPPAPLAPPLEPPYRFSYYISDICKETLGKILDVSAPDPWKIWSGSCKDSLFFPEETTKSWKKRVATEFQVPVRIRNKIIKDPDKFTVVFERGSSQEIDKSWKKRVATEIQDLDRIQNKIIKDPDKFTIIFKTRIKSGNR